MREHAVTRTGIGYDDKMKAHRVCAARNSGGFVVEVVVGQLPLVTVTLHALHVSGEKECDGD
jgi:hypothetical protein